MSLFSGSALPGVFFDLLFGCEDIFLMSLPSGASLSAEFVLSCLGLS